MNKISHKIRLFLLAALLAAPASAETAIRLFTQAKATPGAVLGDTYYTFDATGTIKRLPIGTVGQCLTVVTGPIPGWGACGGGGLSGGTTNRVTYWTSATTVGNTSVTWDSVNNRLGVLAGVPRLALEVNGGLAAPQALNVDVAGSGGILLSNGANVGLLFGLYPSATFAGWIQARNNSGAANTAYDLILQPLGGNVVVGADLRFQNAGGFLEGFKANAAAASNFTWTLPSADGGAGTCLQTNGSLALSFASCGSGAHNLLSATHSDTLAGAPVLGGVLFANATPAWAQLAGNTTATRKFLRQTGTGAVSAAPVWDTLIATDIPTLTTGTDAGAVIKQATTPGTQQTSANLNISGVARADSGVFVGESATNYTLAAGSVALGAKGSGTGQGFVELTSSQADSSGATHGQIVVTDPNNATGANKRLTAIIGATDGPTANNRGGRLAFYTRPDNGAAGVTLRLTLDQAGNVAIGNAALATTATDGFLHLDSMAGAPTGVPTVVYAGLVPTAIDTTNNKVMGYYGAAWHNMSPGGGGGADIQTKTGTESARTGSNAGDLYLPTDAPQLDRYDGAAWASWGPIYALKQPPKFTSATATTLSGNGGSITAGAVSLKVASAAGFPAAPFFIKIGTEQIYVGAVAGTTWSTLGRGRDGTSGATHNDGDAVTYMPWQQVSIDGDTATQYTNGGINLSITSAPAVTIIHVAKQLLGSATHVRLGLLVNLATNAAGVYLGAALVLREGSTNKLATAGAYATSGQPTIIYVQHWTDITGGGATVDRGPVYSAVGLTPFWIGADIGTNIDYLTSPDGVTWNKIATAAKTTQFTTAPDEVGFDLYQSASTLPYSCSATLIHFYTY